VGKSFSTKLSTRVGSGDFQQWKAEPELQIAHLAQSLGIEIQSQKVGFKSSTTTTHLTVEAVKHRSFASHSLLLS
jgi:hypothetical protein